MVFCQERQEKFGWGFWWIIQKTFHTCKQVWLVGRWTKVVENFDHFHKTFQLRNSKNRQQFAMNSFIAYQGRTNVTSRGNFSQRKKLEVECISPGEKRPLGLFLVYVSWTTLGELTSLVHPMPIDFSNEKASFVQNFCSIHSGLKPRRPFCIISLLQARKMVNASS